MLTRGFQIVWISCAALALILLSAALTMHVVTLEIGDADGRIHITIRDPARVVELLLAGSLLLALFGGISFAGWKSCSHREEARAGPIRPPVDHMMHR